MPSFVFHHLGVAVTDIEIAIPIYENTFGHALLSGPFHDPIQKVSVCFVGCPETDRTIIELVEPADGDSPVNEILSKQVGAYHLCYQVEDIEAALSHVRSNGSVIVKNPVPAVAFDGRPIAWLYTPTRQLIELVEK